jgi:hypothetical protein
MSMFKVTGIVTYVSPVETFGAGKESKRIIVQTQDKYPNYFPISFYGQRMDAIKEVKQGDLVEVDTYPGGRLKKGDDTTAFTFLNGANCLVVPTGSTASAQYPSQQSQTSSTHESQKQAKLQNFAFGDDDIPF